MHKWCEQCQKSASRSCTQYRCEYADPVLPNCHFCSRGIPAGGSYIRHGYHYHRNCLDKVEAIKFVEKLIES